MKVRLIYSKWLIKNVGFYVFTSSYVNSFFIHECFVYTLFMGEGQSKNKNKLFCNMQIDLHMQVMVRGEKQYYHGSYLDPKRKGPIRG